MLGLWTKKGSKERMGFLASLWTIYVKCTLKDKYPYVGGASRESGAAVGSVSWRSFSGYVWLKWASGQERESEGGVWGGDKSTRTNLHMRKTRKLSACPELKEIPH